MPHIDGRLRCQNCDALADRLVACAGPVCTMAVGPCCLGATSLCPGCEFEDRRAPAFKPHDGRALMLCALIGGCL